MKSLAILAVIIVIVQILRKKISPKKETKDTSSSPPVKTSLPISDSNPSKKKVHSLSGVSEIKKATINGKPLNSLFEMGMDSHNDVDDSKYDFVDGRLFFLGKKKLMYSDDIGKTWVICKTPSLHSISFPTNKIGFGLGPSGLYKTTDTGENWEKVNPDKNLVKTMRRMRFFNENQGFFLDSNGSRLVTTFNGGRTLHMHPEKARVSEFIQKGNDIMALASLNDAHHFLLDYETKTWKEIPRFDKRRAEQSGCFVNENVGYVVTMTAFVHKTVDGGLSWTEQKVMTDGTAASGKVVDALNEETAIISGSHYGIFLTTDGGSHWKKLDFFPRNGTFCIQHVFFASDTDIIICTDRGIYYSEDFGSSFTPSFLLDIDTIWTPHLSFDLNHMIGQWKVVSLQEYENGPNVSKGKEPYVLTDTDQQIIFQFSKEAAVPLYQNGPYSAYFDIIIPPGLDRWEKKDLTWTIKKEAQTLYLESFTFGHNELSLIKVKDFTVLELTRTTLTIEAASVIKFTFEKVE